jgi:hypothetical protein
LLNPQNIIAITKFGILYRDEKSIVKWIDLIECNRNWQAGIPDPTAFDRQCVGWRNTPQLPQLHVELYTEPKTLIMFSSYVERDSILLTPLQRFGGWLTWDAANQSNS